MLSFCSLIREQKVRLVSAAFGQNGQHIGHHCSCDDEQFNRDLLHGITSFLDEFVRKRMRRTVLIKSKMGAREKEKSFILGVMINSLLLKNFLERPISIHG
jgi:hypothetical protein